MAASPDWLRRLPRSLLEEVACHAKTATVGSIRVRTPFHLAASYDDPTQKKRMSFSTPRDEWEIRAQSLFSFGESETTLSKGTRPQQSLPFLIQLLSLFFGTGLPNPTRRLVFALPVNHEKGDWLPHLTDDGFKGFLLHFYCFDRPDGLRSGFTPDFSCLELRLLLLWLIEWISRLLGWDWSLIKESSFFMAESKNFEFWR